MKFEQRILVFCVLIASQVENVVKASAETDGHIHVAIEVIDFRNIAGTRFLKPGTNEARKCCDSSNNTNCSIGDVCDIRFSLCFGRSSGQWPIHCEGVLVNSSKVFTDMNSAKGPTSVKFAIFSLRSLNKIEKLTIYMIYDDTVQDNSIHDDEMINSFTGSIETEIDSSFWTSKQHLMTLTKCASVTLGIRLFCESNYYGENCTQHVTPDMFHHIDIVNGSTKHVLDCKTNGSSVINILTTDPYKYTLPYLKKKLMLFLVDKVCSLSANDVIVVIDNVRYTNGKLRVAFNGNCLAPITDLEVQHALNYMESDEIVKYFGDNVERLDETPLIRQGRFNIVYRLLDVFRGEKYKGCEGNRCNISLRISYRNQSVSNWDVTFKDEMNYCFRGLENTQNNTVHIVSGLAAEDTAPLDIKLEIHPVKENRKNILTFNIPVINFTEKSVVGNSYRHFHAAEIQRIDKLSGVGFKIGLFVWCSTGYTGKRCEEKCNSTELDCNYEKCQSDGQNKYAHTIHCAQGMCNDSTKLCDCNPGYIGPICKTHLDHCKFGWAKNPCLNGKCTNHANGFTCECTRYYTGKFCELRLMTYANTSRSKREVLNGSIILPAKSTLNGAKNVIKQCPFSNNCGNGTSFVFKDTLKCICDFGFKGDRCKQVDHCATKPCLYSGICQNIENTFSCKCQNGFRGIKCGMVNECEDSFCQNDATCMNITSSNIKCICKKGFTGKFCQIKTYCETKTCTNETKCNDHNNVTQTCFTPKTTNHSMQKLFVKLLPALRPEGIDEDNITDSVKMLLENITQNCAHVRVMFDVFSFANGSSNIYIGVLCDGKLLSATLIGHQFKHFHTDEIINILHFVPKNNENTPAAEVGHIWIEDNWIILIGILVAVVAVLIGLVKSLHIIYGIRPDRRLKRKVTTIRKRNNYVDVFENGTKNVQNTDETNKPHIYSSGLGSSYVIDSRSGRQDNLQHVKSNGYTSSIYNGSAKPPLSNDAKFINGCYREHGTEAVNDEELRGPHYEARFPSPLLNGEQNYRNSYIDSKMAFLARNPIYGLGSDNW